MDRPHPAALPDRQVPSLAQADRHDAAHGPGPAGNAPLSRGLIANHSVIAELLSPVDGATLRSQIEQVPDRLQGADVARLLPRIRGRI